jgi:hypothetical protein
VQRELVQAVGTRRHLPRLPFRDVPVQPQRLACARIPQPTFSIVVVVRSLH